VSGRVHGLLRPRLEVAELFPPIEEELGPYRHLFTGNVLNAGCGDRDIRSLVPGRLYNQDIAEGLHNADVDIESPLDRIPVEDGFFNTIICNAVLEHVANPEDVMREFARVCAPGGTLYLTIPFMQPEHKDPTDFQRYTLDGLGLLCQRHGFRVVELHGVHSVYTTLSWILTEWLDPLPTRRAAVLRAVLYPWLKRKLRTARHHVPSLASAHRAIAIRIVDAI
jgi:SAM-dependent methyltransferase